MFTSKALKGLTAASAAAFLALGTAGVASAQVTVIPGDNGDGRTVTVNAPGMEVDVVSVDREAGTVEVTMTNSVGFDVFCEAADQDSANRFGGTVSTAKVVEKSVEYYQNFQNTKADMIDIASGSVTLALWPLAQLMPQGSVGDMASDMVKLRSEITEANTYAKVQGLYGTTGSFRLNNGASATRTITLGPPASQPRGEDKIGFLTMCGQGVNSNAVQGNAKLFAWSALEQDPVPDVDEDTDDDSIDDDDIGGGEG